MQETQNLKLKTYDFGVDDTDDFVNGVAGSADSNMHILDKAITEKVLLNGTTTNVNFKKNEIVQDGLMGVYNKTLQTITVNNNNSIVYGEFILNSNNQFVWFDGLNTGITAHEYTTYTDKTKIRYSNSFNVTTLFYQKDKKYRYICEINTENKTIRTAFYDGMDFLEEILYQYESNRTLNRIEYRDIIINLTSFIYNRKLTQKEIQHNFSVLNNTPAISSIETTDKTSFLFATDSDHVTTPTGHTEEERHTALLSKFGKKFTSTGEDITVENGIETQRVLSAKISGQTVKNYVFEELFGNNIYYGVEGNEITVKQTDGTAWNNKKYINVESGEYGEYAFICDKNVIIDSTDIGAISLKANEASYKSITQPFRLKLLPGANAMPFKCKFAIVKKGEEAKINLGTLQFGLNSTQAIITNNGLKYSF